MSEADRVFPARKGQATQLLPTREKRFIRSRPRRGEPGSGQPRVVEVVHVRRDQAQHRTEPSRPARNLRAETWPDGFSAKPAPIAPEPEIAPAAAEPVQPAVHVMPMWKP